MSLSARVTVLCLALLGPAAVVHADAPAVASPLGSSYLGIHTRSNANVLEAQNLEEGVTVTRVGENSPASAAGVRAGDVLLQANGVSIAHPSQLDELVEALPVGGELKLKLERDEVVVEVSARTVALVAALQPDDAEVQVGAEAPVEPTTWIERRRVGFEFGPLDAERMRSLGLNPREGVEVRRLAQASPLRAAGVQTGDVLLRVQGRTIRDPRSLIDFLDGLTTEKALTWSVQRGNEPARDLEIPTHKPEWRLQRLSVPLLFNVSRTQEKSDYSFALGLVRIERYETGARVRLAYFFEIKTGAWDELLEVEGS